MEEKNELNDIILNKGTTTGGNKKIILAVATLGVILIIVVMLMNTLTSNGTDNLPQAVLPPEPQISSIPVVEEEPLFEEVEVIQEDSQSDNLDNIAQKLKQESLAEVEVVEEPVVAVAKPIVKKKKHVAKKSTAKRVVKKRATHRNTIATTDAYYIQVGSFSKYAPNKKFLKSITNRGYNYKYHKVTVKGKTLNKVLVGPFKTEKEAKNARTNIRLSIEPGAFLVKL